MFTTLTAIENLTYIAISSLIDIKHKPVIGDLIYGSDSYYAQITGVGGHIVEFNVIGQIVSVDALNERIDNIIAGTLEGASAQEIIDARDGEATLGANITNVKLQLAQIPPQIRTIKIFDKKPTTSQLLTGEVGLVKKPIETSILFTKKPTLSPLTRTNINGNDTLYFWTRNTPLGRTLDLNLRDYVIETTFRLETNTDGVHINVGLYSSIDNKVVRFGLNTINVNGVSARAYQNDAIISAGNLTFFDTPKASIVSPLFPLTSLPANQPLTLRLTAKNDNTAKLSVIGANGLTLIDTNYSSFYYTSASYDNVLLFIQTQGVDGVPPTDYIDYVDSDVQLKSHVISSVSNTLVNNIKIEV